MSTHHEKLTQFYSSWGDKLLQHADVLHSIQEGRKFKPITIQLAPTEICSSDCPFCSVAGRPLKSYMPFDKIKKCLSDFASLGAKSCEITGGGEPLLYRDKETGATINDIVRYAYELGLDVGIITNSNDLKRLDQAQHYMIKWLRISLIKLDEGYTPADYDFNQFPTNRLSLSYVIYETDGVDAMSRTKKIYRSTSPEVIRMMARFIDAYPDIKFVRLQSNCLIKGSNITAREKFKDVVDEVDRLSKFFIKEIHNDDGPFEDGCFVGLLRPYVAPNPHGGDYQVYICTSHVLNTRTYDLNYSLCSVDNILEAWDKMNEEFKKTGRPYEVNNSKKCGWGQTCKFCHYKNNNKLLFTVANEMPDKNFS